MHASHHAVRVLVARDHVLDLGDHVRVEISLGVDVVERGDRFRMILAEAVEIRGRELEDVPR